MCGYLRPGVPLGGTSNESGSLQLWFYLAPFLRYGDLLAKNCIFFLPHSHLAPSSSLCSLWNFAVKLTRVMGLSYREKRPHDRSLSRFHTVPTCNGRTADLL